MLVRSAVKRYRVHKQHQSQEGQRVLARLKAFLDTHVQEPGRLLYRMMGNQQQAMQYKELREAICRGDITEETFLAWQQEYARFATEHLYPIWMNAAKAGAAYCTLENFAFREAALLDWIEKRGAQWVTNCADTTRQGLKAVLTYGFTQGLSTDDLAHVIRPMIGLTKRQALANARYFMHVRGALLERNVGMREATATKRAREAALKYAARQHRERARVIAETELAFAYNKGMQETVRQAMAQGLMGYTVKVWSTSGDDRVCPICVALEGVELGIDERFPFPGRDFYEAYKETPPAHPRCHCAVEYREISAPVYQGEGGLHGV